MGPTAVALDEIAVHRPMARAFCVGSGKAALTSASDATLVAAAATPWIVRATLRTNSVGAKPQATEDSVNTATLTR